MRNNPTGAMGLRDYLGRRWISRRGLPIVNLPGCPAQPDNITETLLHLALHVAGAWRPPLELDEQGRPRRLFDRTVQRGVRPRRARRAGRSSPRRTVTARLPGQARLQGPGRQVQRPDPRLDQRDRRLPQRRRDLHGLHDARVPGQVHAVPWSPMPRPGCYATNREVHATDPSSAPARSGGSGAPTTSSRSGASAVQRSQPGMVGER